MSDSNLPDFADKVMENVTSSLSQNVGQTFGDLWFLVFGGISQKAEMRRARYAHNLHIYKEELEKSIAKIPEEKRIAPNTHIAMKALFESQYCVEEPVLRRMFANLISKTMNVDTASKAHPSFAEIISRMSSYDALLLTQLASDINQPVVKYVAKYPDTAHLVCLDKNVLAINGKLYDDITTTSESLNILESLGLIQIDYSQYLADPNIYDPFLNSLHYQELVKNLTAINNKPVQISIERGHLSLTDFGNRFCTICIE